MFKKIKQYVVKFIPIKQTKKRTKFVVFNKIKNNISKNKSKIQLVPILFSFSNWNEKKNKVNKKEKTKKIEIISNIGLLSVILYNIKFFASKNQKQNLLELLNNNIQPISANKTKIAIYDRFN